ncbi:hypothetical protein B0H11DRAFT_1640775, partial [Mycena galericulata]
MGMDGKTLAHTSIDPETFAISLRRLHPWIANYNDVVMFLLKCNMDIKFVGSGEAAKAFLYYITDYITKPSLPVHVGLAALTHAISVTNSKFPQLADASQSTADAYVGAMTSTVNSMMGFQEISHPQVLSYMIGGGDHYSSDKFVILWWGAVKRYVGTFFPSGDPLQVDCETIEAGVVADVGVDISISLGAGTISASNQLMDYTLRCTSPGFERLCLYDFVSRVVKRGLRANNASTWPGKFSDESHPQFLTHYQASRRERHIPVVLGPKIHRWDRSDEERELWAQDIVTLFKPWRTPTDLKRPQDTWMETVVALRTDIEPWKDQIIRNMNVLAECRDARKEHPRHRGRDESTAAVVSQSMDGLIAQGRVLMEETNPYSVLDHADIEVGDTGYQAVGESAVGLLVGEQCLSALRMCLVNANSEGTGSPALGRVEEVDTGDHEFLKSYARTMNTLRKKRRPDHSDEAEQPNKRARIDSAPDAFVKSLVPGSDIFVGSSSTKERRAIIETVLLDMKIYSNAEQLRAMRIISKHVLDGGSQLLMYVAGVGGTGKSHLIKSVVLMFQRLG